MAYISNSKMLLVKITKKEIICYKIRKNARKIIKFLKKIPTGLESPQNSK